MEKSICEAAAEAYKGKMVQIYFNQSGGVHNYFDHSVNYNTYTEGVVLWGEGDVLALEIDFELESGTVKKTVLFNGWLITFVTEKDVINPSYLLKNHHGLKVAQK